MVLPPGISAPSSTGSTLVGGLAARLHRGHRIVPGLTIAAFGAGIATYLAIVTGGPASLFAIMAGLLLRRAVHDPVCEPGLVFSSGRLLQVAVVLLAARISFHDVAALGPEPFAVVGVSLVGALAIALALSRLMRLDRGFAWTAGLGVAICGASAAVAAASLLPRTARRDATVLLVTLSVTVLSTAAMLTYPLVAAALGFDETETGLLLGATIHDLAQVIGAGYAVSDVTGDAAVVTKLIRVALLAPALLAMSWALGAGRPGRIAVPPFLVAFLLLSLITSTGLLPAGLGEALARVSSAGFLMAICVIAMRLRWTELLRADPRQLAAIGAHTLVLLGLAAILIGVFHP